MTIRRMEDAKIAKGLRVELFIEDDGTGQISLKVRRRTRAVDERSSVAEMALHDILKFLWARPESEMLLERLGRKRSLRVVK
jgi:hypothetical protein